jgi:6-phosphogluconolactonase (cycloisomerase 2 family)
MFSHAIAGARAAGLALLAAALLAACGSDDPPESPTVTPAAARLLVDTGSAAPVAGGTLTLKATLLAADGTEVKGASFAWTSSDPAVATVASASDKAPAASASVMGPVGTYATIQTLAAGAADITATATLADGSRISSITHLVVQAAPAKSYTLVLTPASLVVTAGGAAQTVTVAVRRSDGVDGAGDLTNWAWTTDGASFVATPAADGHSAQVASPVSAVAAAAGVLTACADAPAGGRLCANAALSRGAAPTIYTVGGTVSGLAAGKSLQLADTNGDTQVVNANGSFAMPASRAVGTAYNVTVVGQPAGQTCTVGNGSGTLAAASVTNIAITCVQAQFAVVANSTDRTLSVYRIDPISGALAAVQGSPFAATGQIADLAFLPSGRVAYALMRDTDRLMPFALDPASGVLEAVPAAAIPSPIAGVRTIAVSPSGQSFYVGLDSGWTFRYDVDAASGMPRAWTSNIKVGSATQAGTAIAISPDEQWIYVAGTSADAVTTLRGDLYIGFFADTPSGGIGPNAAVLSPNGAFLYTPNMGSGTVGVHALAAGSGLIVGTNAFAVGSAPTDIAMAPSGQFAYVANSGSNNISSLQIDATTGMPTTAPVNVAAGIGTQRLRVTPNGKFLYAPALNGSVYGYAINGTSGALTAVPGSPFPTGNGNVAIAIVEPRP